MHHTPCVFEQIFAKSPFKLLEKHIITSVACCNLLQPFFQAAFANDWSKAETIHKDIADLETQADHMKAAFTISLKTHIYLPVSKFELLSLMQTQDGIPNKTEDISGLTLSRSLQLPSAVHDAFLTFIYSAVQACTHVQRIIAELDHAQKLYFCANVHAKMKTMIQEIDTLEHTNDTQQLQLRKLIKEHEHAQSTIDTLFTYKILDRIGFLADCAHHVGARLIILTSV